MFTAPQFERRVVRHKTPEHEALLKARFGEPGDWRGDPEPFVFEGHRWRYVHTSFDDIGSYDVIERPADAPTGLAKAGLLSPLVGLAAREDPTRALAVKIARAITDSCPGCLTGTSRQFEGDDRPCYLADDRFDDLFNDPNNHRGLRLVPLIESILCEQAAFLLWPQ